MHAKGQFIKYDLVVDSRELTLIFRWEDQLGVLSDVM